MGHGVRGAEVSSACQRRRRLRSPTPPCRNVKSAPAHARRPYGAALQHGEPDLHTTSRWRTRCRPWTVSGCRSTGGCCTPRRSACRRPSIISPPPLGCGSPSGPAATARSDRSGRSSQKKWLAAQPAAATIRALQHQLDRFAGYYNTTRPHRALGRRSPAQAYADRPKAFPTGIKIPAHYRVRHDTIDTGGTVTLRHNSRLHHIGSAQRRVAPASPCSSTTCTSASSTATPAS